MFESLQEGLASAVRTLRGKGKLTEANMRDGLELVQQALLEADVSYPVVKDFMAEVTEGGRRRTGAEIARSQPAGGRHRPSRADQPDGPGRHSLHLKPDMTVLMMCGLQGSGKTTTCGKLAG